MWSVYVFVLWKIYKQTVFFDGHLKKNALDIF